MARNSTLYQCFNFLARAEGTIGFAPHPDDPCKNRMTIRIGETVATIEYACTEEIDMMERVLGPVCRTLEDHLEKEFITAKYSHPANNPIHLEKEAENEETETVDG